MRAQGAGLVHIWAHSLDRASKPGQRDGQDTHFSLLFSHLTIPPLNHIAVLPARKMRLTAKDDLLHSSIRMVLIKY